MPHQPPAAPLLRENILFLIAGTFVGSTTLLLLDNRLYTGREVLALFLGLFVLFLIRAFDGRFQNTRLAQKPVLLLAESFGLSAGILCLLYGLVMPYPFELTTTLKFSLVVTFIETSLHFFARSQKQAAVIRGQEARIGAAAKQQQVKELEVLKQQIDPHFIFNSFNTLSFLIDEDPERAKRFSNKLANVYRYIIFNSNKNLVALADEVGFAKDYAYLQEIRHANEVRVQFSVPPELEKAFVLPVSLQLLIENAIKHNSFSEAEPLAISVSAEGAVLTVENNLSPKNFNLPSSKIGLANLRNRCRLILGKDLQQVRTETSFKVILPLLRQ